MITNQKHIKNLQVDTLAELGNTSAVYCYCRETNTLYQYISDGSSYHIDNLVVVSTPDGGNTRWLGIAGDYAIKTSSHLIMFPEGESMLNPLEYLATDPKYPIDTTPIVTSPEGAYFRAHGTAQKDNNNIYIGGRDNYLGGSPAWPSSFTHFYDLPNIDKFKVSHASIPMSTVYNDWFVPSRDELLEMYENLHEGDGYTPVGDFENAIYWSSSEKVANTNHAHYVNLGTGGLSFYDKYHSNLFRFARSFVGTVGDYSIRDEGPASGSAAEDKTYIFHIEDLGGDDRRFYECSPKSSEVNTPWSTPLGETGATGFDIGLGASHTLKAGNWLIESNQLTNRGILSALNYEVYDSVYIHFRNLDSMVHLVENIGGIDRDVIYTIAEKINKNYMSILRIVIDEEPAFKAPLIEEFMLLEDSASSSALLTDGEYLYVAPRTTRTAPFYSYTGTFNLEGGGTSTEITITATDRGRYDWSTGVLFFLTGDGVSSVDQLITNWNFANPHYQAELTSGDGTQIPQNTHQFGWMLGTITTHNRTDLYRIHIDTKVVDKIEDIMVEFSLGSGSRLFHAGLSYDDGTRHEGYMISGSSANQIVLKIDYNGTWPNNIEAITYSVGGVIHDDCAIHPEGRYLYWSSEMGNIRVFRMDLEDPLHPIEDFPSVPSYCVATDGDDLYMAHGSATTPIEEQGFVKYYDFHPPQMVQFALGIPFVNEMLFDNDYVYMTSYINDPESPYYSRLIRAPKDMFTIEGATFYRTNTHKLYVVIPEDVEHETVFVLLPRSSAFERSLEIEVINNSYSTVILSTTYSTPSRDVLVPRFVNQENKFSYALDGYSRVKVVSVCQQNKWAVISIEDKLLRKERYVTTSITVGINDLNKNIIVDSEDPENVEIPHNDTESIPVGFEADITQWGDGVVTIAFEPGVTLNNENGLQLSGKYAKATVLKVDENTWLVTGDLTT